MTPVTVHVGTGPVVLAFPHSGTFVPDTVRNDLNDRGRALSDTDWHVTELYAGLLPQASTVTANFHRYVIDANRDPSGQSLYPGQATTDLIPETDFDGNPIWATLPTQAARMERLAQFHEPYHAALEAELQRVWEVHGFAVLYDCHSIRSRVPRLFDGWLPDFNIGTFDGVSCDSGLAQIVEGICCSAPEYSTVVNGRFKGGWTTRHFGRPADGIHAVQMELAQATHLKTETAPWGYDAEKAAGLRVVLKRVLEAIDDWSPA